MNTLFTMSNIRKIAKNGYIRRVVALLPVFIVAIILQSCDPGSQKTSQTGQVFGDGNNKADWIPKYEPAQNQGYHKMEPQKTEAFFQLRK